MTCTPGGGEVNGVLSYGHADRKKGHFAVLAVQYNNQSGFPKWDMVAVSSRTFLE
jgi:hypothetical protein